MNNIPNLSIIASGMVTAAGCDTASTAAAVRARVSGVRTDNIWDPTAGEYMAVGRPHMMQWWEGPDMLAELAVHAVFECLNALPNTIAPQSVPILILLPPADRPFREPDLEQIVSEELERRLGFPMPAGSQTFGTGRTGLLDALDRLARFFTERKVRYGIVVGVDTFLRQRVVEAYFDRERLLTEDNPSGFLPGEAACAVLLSLPSVQAPHGLHIVGYGRAREAGAIESDDPLSGDGLTEALREALDQAGITMADTDQWLTDQNAEAYKAKECTVAQIRLERRTDPNRIPYDIQHPIEFLGEIGSAIGPCLLGLQLAAHHGGYAHGPFSLFSIGEDNGDRVALVLQWTERS